MNSSKSNDKKMAILAKTWDYLLSTGLSHASVGELCKTKKIAQSSLYYWFKNKEDVWIEAGKFGMSRVVDALFSYTLDHTDDLDTYFTTLLGEVEKYKYDIRLAIQITTSPVYGSYMRDKSLEFNVFYENFGLKLMEIFNCTKLQAEVFILSIVTYVVDYAIWDDRAQTQKLLDNLYKNVIKAISKPNK